MPVQSDEYREVLSRLDILEHDVADIKVEQREQRREMGEFRQDVNERFDRVNERFDQLQNRFDDRLDKMNERLLAQTRWMVGTIALFGTLITVLLAISQFTP